MTEASHWDEEAEHPAGVDSRVWSDDHYDGVSFCGGMIGPWLPAEGTVLDLGCGVGRLTIPFADLFVDLNFVGLDVSPKMLAEAKRRSAGVRPNLRFELGDGRTLPFEDDSLAGAFSVVTLQHIPDEAVRGYLAEIARCLMPKATFFFQFTVGTENEAYSRCRSTDDIVAWVYAAGLDAFIHHEGVGDPVWAWCEAVKP